MNVVHLSDLHFGTELSMLAESLKQRCRDIGPDVVIVTGDFTQRARNSQFKKAKQFMDDLPHPQLIVPGNHDIPLFDFLRRLISPFGRYRRYLQQDLDPIFSSSKLHVVGLNTARPWTWKSGRISKKQLARLATTFCPLPRAPDSLTILASHHPFIPPAEDPTSGVESLPNAASALDFLDFCKIDLLLAGHLHVGYIADIRTYFAHFKRSIIVAQAGTAISRRTRSQPNGFNWIQWDGERLLISVMAWMENDFVLKNKFGFRKQGGEWIQDKE